MAVPKPQKLGVWMTVYRQDRLCKDYTSDIIPISFFFNCTILFSVISYWGATSIEAEEAVASSLSNNNMHSIIAKKYILNDSLTLSRATFFIGIIECECALN